MRFLRPAWFVSAFLLFAAGLTLTGCGSPKSGAPSVALPTYEGDVVSISPKDSLVSLVVFWATWCIPCIEEIPQLKHFQKTYADKGFRVVSINIDDPQGHTAPLMAQQFGINYPVLVDDGSGEKAFGGVRALPTSFLVGRDGTIKRRLEGLYPQETLESIILDELALGQIP